MTIMTLLNGCNKTKTLITQFNRKFSPLVNFRIIMVISRSKLWIKKKKKEYIHLRLRRRIEFLVQTLNRNNHRKRFIF